MLNYVCILVVMIQRITKSLKWFWLFFFWLTRTELTPWKEGETNRRQASVEESKSTNPWTESGDDENKAKLTDWVLPKLAIASVQVLPSQYMWETWTLGILCNSDLQSSTRVIRQGWTLDLLSIKLTINKASNSTKTWEKPMEIMIPD